MRSGTGSILNRVEIFVKCIGWALKQHRKKIYSGKSGLENQQLLEQWFQSHVHVVTEFEAYFFELLLRDEVLVRSPLREEFWGLTQHREKIY